MRWGLKWGGGEVEEVVFLFYNLKWALDGHISKRSSEGGFGNQEQQSLQRNLEN